MKYHPAEYICKLMEMALEAAILTLEYKNKINKTMKTFRHKKTFNIAIETNSSKNYKVNKPQNYTIPSWIIESSNDWEEVKECITTQDKFRVTDENQFITIMDKDFKCQEMRYGVFKISSLNVPTTKVFGYFENAVNYAARNEPKFSEQQLIDTIIGNINETIASILLKKFDINID